MIPKFRAWSKLASRMYIVNGLYFDRGMVQYANNDNVIRFIKLENIILMQSTGLKDKNGQEIFEGDILKFNDEWEDYCQEGYVDGSSEGINYVLIGSEMTYFIFEKTKYPDSSLFYYVNEEHLTFQEVMEDNEFEFEIVGNIYENPELLEVTE